MDYTLRSGPGRLHEVLPEEAAELEKTPFAVIQVVILLQHARLCAPAGLLELSHKVLIVFEVASLACQLYLQITCIFQRQPACCYVHPCFQSSDWVFCTRTQSRLCGRCQSYG